MALKEWKNERSFTSCEDCGSWSENGCRMDLQPVRAGFNAAGDFYDCKNFHLAPKKEVKVGEETPAPAVAPAAPKKEEPDNAQQEAEVSASAPLESEPEAATVEGPAVEKEAPKKEVKAKAKKTSKKK
jgi:hypothetical protein